MANTIKPFNELPTIESRGYRFIRKNPANIRNTFLFERTRDGRLEVWGFSRGMKDDDVQFNEMRLEFRFEYQVGG